MPRPHPIPAPVTRPRPLRAALRAGANPDRRTWPVIAPAFRSAPWRAAAYGDTPLPTMARL